MKISLDWLKEFIELDESPEAISEVLTATGLEVEGLEIYEEVEGNLEGIVIGEVLTCEQHSNADKLKVTTVDIGREAPSPVVCGAPNVAVGQKVVVAIVNTTLHPVSGDSFKIKKAKIRGEVSEGMICAEDEIGLGAGHDGIMVLDTDLPNGTPAAEYFNLTRDSVIEIGLTPNRADAASHLGVARDLKAAYRREVMMPDLSSFAVDNETSSIEVVVEDSVACPRYSGISISDITVAESPKWLKNRLQSIGLAPINNIVDITNYVLHSLGQPMHAFDADAITGGKVIVKAMPEGTTFTTLDEKERKLSNTDLMICNASEGMCIAGVFGGVKSGVTEKTKNVFLESAYFSADSVRKTAMKHGLKTDASFRYERGTDPNMNVYALKKTAMLIKELAGGTISSQIIDVYPEPIANWEVPIKYSHINRLIGKEIPKARVNEILKDLDINVSEKSDDEAVCNVPPYRVDVQREADIIEEVLRVYGYNNIELEESYGTGYLANFPKPDKDKLQEKVTYLLASSGFNEIITNSLTNPSLVEKSGLWKVEDNVNILNKLSEELGVLRQTMIFSGLESLKHNINRKQENLRFFEFGRSYHLASGEYNENNHLALFVTGNKQEESWRQSTDSVEFHDISGAIQKILSKFNIDQVESIPTSNEYFEYGLDLTCSSGTLASFGALTSKITKMSDVSRQVFFADINWGLLLKMSGKKIIYKAVSKFPEVRRDLSLVIKKTVTFAEIKALAQKQERKLIKRMNVFSVYEGENIGSDNKSYALSFILQDESKTLTDKQIDKVLNGLIRNFEQNLNAVIRK